MQTEPWEKLDRCIHSEGVDHWFFTVRTTESSTVSPRQQALRSFKVTMSVDPKFHPKIIGRKGAVISQIRKEHDVSIQFPDKGDEEQVSGCCCDQDTSQAGDPDQEQETVSQPLDTAP